MDDPLLVFTFVLALATVLLGAATVGLWVDTKRGGKTAAANARAVAESVKNQALFGRAQMRAYVTVVIGNAIYQDDTHVFEAQPVVVNKGFTTARKLRWRIAADVLPFPPPADFKYPLPKDVGGGTDLDGQQDGIMSAVIRDRRKLEPLDAQSTKMGEGMALTVWGYLWYDDVFGKRHRRTFSQQIWWIPVGDRRLDGSYPMGIRGHHLRHNRGN